MTSPERLYRAEAVVLRRSDLGEADRILTLFTRGHGKVRAVAKGVRRPASKKAGHVELFTRVDVLLAQGRTLDVVSQAEMLDAFRPLRDDLERAAYAAHFVELLDDFTEDSDQHDDLYDLLVSALRWLCETGDMRRTARYYELRLLDLVGYRPQLFECVICGQPIQAQDQFYSPVDGGVVCPSCAPDTPRIRPISLGALKVLRYLQQRSFDTIDQLKLGDSVQAEVERIMFDFLTFHLERRLKSAAFLERLRREARP